MMDSLFFGYVKGFVIYLLPVFFIVYALLLSWEVYEQILAGISWPIAFGVTVVVMGMWALLVFGYMAIYRKEKLQKLLTK